jgi:hypothetical protein
MTGVRVRDLHERWAQDPEYRAAYDAMEDEFASEAERIRARHRAAASQTAPARHMSAWQPGEIEGWEYLPSVRPSILHMTEEKERVLARLVRIDAERTKLAEQLNELEITERVLTRFGGSADTAERRRRGRPARTAAGAAPQRGVHGGQQAAASVSLSDATLQAVKSHPDGATANDILNHLSREFGMTVRPNHLGIALQRLRRSGRLENRDQRWYPAQQAGGRIERLERSATRY